MNKKKSGIYYGTAHSSWEELIDMEMVITEGNVLKMVNPFLAGHLVVDDSVHHVADNAFHDSKLDEITLSKNTESIADSAFVRIEHLGTVHVPEGMDSNVLSSVATLPRTVEVDVADTKPKYQLNKARENLVALFSDCLKAGRIPWHQGYVPSQTSFNPFTKTVYKNSNRFILYMNEYVNDYKDPRWMTFKQAKEHGYSVKKGSKGVPIEYWSLYDKKEKKPVSFQEAKVILTENPEREQDLKYIAKVYTVFNGTQIDGLEPYVAPKNENKFDDKLYPLPLAVMKSFSKNASLRIEEDETVSTPYYSIQEDYIRVPERSRYYSEEAFFSDVYHEMSHATSHESRLNRVIVPYAVSPGDYALEELRAEIASAFTCDKMGVKSKPNEDYVKNSVAYVQSWLRHLEEKPNALFTAIRDGEKISEYILDKGDYQKHREFYEQYSAYFNDGEYTPGGLSNDDLIFHCQDSEFEYVEPEEMRRRIEAWDSDSSSIEHSVFFTVENNGVITCADNTSGDCFVEDFDEGDGLMAFMWMNGSICYEDYTIACGNAPEVK